MGVTMTDATTKTYWLSFVDADRPEGARWLGAAIVQVTAAEAQAWLSRLPPSAQPGAEWIAAALRSAHQHGCNPGGEVGSVELPVAPPAEWLYRLLTLAETEDLNEQMEHV